MLLNFIVGAIGTVSLAASVANVILRRQSFDAQVTLLRAEGEAVEPARQKRSKAHSRYLSTVVVVMACYALSILALLISRLVLVTETLGIDFASLIATSVAIAVIGIVAEIYNMKETEARITTRFYSKRSQSEPAFSGPKPPDPWD